MVPRVEEAKFLGIWLDRKLKRNIHLDRLISKGRKIADIITMLLGLWWGSHPTLLLRIYRSMFRGAVEYGSHAFCMETCSLKFLKFKRLMHRIISTALGYRISTPINVMFSEACELPLNICFICLAFKCAIKCFSNQTNPVTHYLECLAFASRRRSDKLNLLKTFFIFERYTQFRYLRNVIFSSLTPPDSLLNYYAAIYRPTIDTNLHHLVSKDDSDAEIQQIFLAHRERFCNSLMEIFTDGSKSLKNCRAMAAVYLPHIKAAITHKLSISIFSAEALALFQTIKFTSEDATIYTDSLIVLKAIESFSTKNNNYLISRIKQKLFEKDHRIST